MSTTGHLNEAIDVKGLKASLQKLKTDHIDSNTNGLASEILRAQAAEALKANSADVYTKSETYTKTEVNGLVDSPHQNYVTVEDYASLPSTGQAADTIYRVSSYDGENEQVDVTKYSEYAWDGTKYVFLCVKSQIGEVFDITVYNNNTKYADLTAALGTNGANIPDDLRKGGMSVKYVSSSDNKYVQFRYMGTSTANADFTNVANWQGVDSEPVIGSRNLVESGGAFNAIKNVNIVDGGANTKEELSFVDENDNCIGQFKNGHIKTKNFDSSESATRTYVDNKVATDINAAKEEVLEKVAEVDNAERDDESLSFVDEDSNCILQAKNGHIQTKNFNSADAAMKPNVAEVDNDDKKSSCLSLIDENDNCVAQFKDGHIKTKEFDSRNVEKTKSFLALTISHLQVSGTAAKTGNNVILGGGTNNRAYINSQLHNWHYTMAAKFRCTAGGVSFILGKDSTVYGAYVEVSKDNSGSYLKMYNMGNLVNTQNYTLDFSLNENEDYLLKVSSDITSSKIWKVELYGEYGEYFSYTSTSDIQGYGQPYVYSSSTSCTLKEYSFSVQRYYDVKDARISVLGHSYVEADSLGTNRTYCFANLLAQAVGEKKCINFGQGGLTASQLVAMLPNCLPLAKYIEYAVIMIGGNDTSLSSQTLIGYVQEICQILLSNNIKPILCTQAPMPALGGLLPVLTDMNAWIRSSGYLYCDIEQVFLDVDVETTPYTDITNENIKSELYLTDNIHPTVAGHELMFSRMMMDCPFIF